MKQIFLKTGLLLVTLSALSTNHIGCGSASTTSAETDAETEAAAVELSSNTESAESVLSTSLRNVSDSLGDTLSPSVSALVKARLVTAAMAQGNAELVVADTTLSCDFDSDGTGSGELIYNSANMTIDDESVANQASANGDINVNYNTCAYTVTLTTSDGTCDYAVSIEGDLVEDYSGIFSTAGDGVFEITAIVDTTGDLTVTIDGVAHTFDTSTMQMNVTNDVAAVFTGTVTIDGTDVDLSTVDSSTYTTAELCP
jgi:hypothetical protein